jgi:hypothetical protein
MHKPEVALRDPHDRDDCLSIDEVGVLDIEAELRPAPGEDERQSLVLQWAVGVSKPDAAVELRVAGELLVCLTSRSETGR